MKGSERKSSNNGIHKPHHSSKSSDRRVAGGRKPVSYLHSVISGAVAALPTQISSTNIHQVHNDESKTVKRTSGSKSWEDSSLLEWNPKHFRLFVGNLGDDANDSLLFNSFKKYQTISKVKVPIDKKTGKNKGYGFVAFESSDDYFKAFKEMNGKYIGQHPVQLKRAETNIKATKKHKRK